jgi:hypothetical protein
VPLADVNSLFKLYRTAFLKRFPIQSDGDFVTPSWWRRRRS